MASFTAGGGGANNNPNKSLEVRPRAVARARPPRPFACTAQLFPWLSLDSIRFDSDGFVRVPCR
jgi:hypothetical protein